MGMFVFVGLEGFCREVCFVGLGKFGASLEPAISDTIKTSLSSHSRPWSSRARSRRLVADTIRRALLRVATSPLQVRRTDEVPTHGELSKAGR